MFKSCPSYPCPLYYQTRISRLSVGLTGNRPSVYSIRSLDSFTFFSMRFSRYDEVSSMIPSVAWFLLAKYLFSAGPSEPSKRYMREFQAQSLPVVHTVLLKLFFTAFALRRSVAPAFLSASACASADRPGMFAVICFNLRMSP